MHYFFSTFGKIYILQAAAAAEVFVFGMPREMLGGG